MILHVAIARFLSEVMQSADDVSRSVLWISGPCNAYSAHRTLARFVLPMTLS